MKRTIKLILSAVLLVLAVAVCGQRRSGSLQLEFYATDLMPSNDVNAIYRDGEGMIWLGTADGLSRFDGYEFVAMRDDASPAGALLQADISKIVKGYGSEIWLITGRGEVAAFDIATYRVRKIETTIPPGERINTLIPTDGDALLIGSMKGLYHCDPRSGSCQQHLPDRISSVRTLYEDSRGNIWIGTWASGVWIYRPDTGEFSMTDLPVETKVNAFSEIPGGKMFIATWGDGVMEVEAPLSDSMKFTSYRSDSIHRYVENSDIIYSMALDGNGLLWMATPTGIRTLDGDGRQMFYDTYTRYGSDNRRSKLNEVFSVITDLDDNVWISFAGVGLALNVDPDNSIRNYDLAGLDIDFNHVDAIYRDGATGYLWLGVQGAGLVVYDPRGDDDVSYRYREIVSRINLRANSVMAFAEDAPTRRLFVATRYDGVFVIDMDSGVAEHFRDAGTEETRCTSITVDRHGNAFVGTVNGVFTIQRDRVTGNSIFVQPPELYRSTASLSVSSLITTERDELWIAAGVDGIFKTGYDAAEGRFSDIHRIPNLSYPNYSKASIIFEDSKGRIWAGTSEGLLLYDVASDSFEDRSDFLSTRTGNITQMTEDADGNLWIASNSWIVRYDPDRGNDSYRRYAGNHIMFSYGALYNGGSDIYMGGLGGIAVFSPSEMPFAQDDILPLIVDVKVFNRSISEMTLQEREYITDTMPPLARSVRFKHNQNSISFKFSATGKRNNALYDYSYRLTDVDKEWRNATSSQRDVTYSNLRPGDYTFQVRVCSEFGIWSDSMAELDITIIPPIWMTRWAIMIYVALFGLAVYLTVMSVIKRIERKKEQYRQAMEKAKMEEVYDAKLTFFTNVSHELFTPITVMSCSLDALFEKNDVDPKLYTLIRSNLNRLMRLLQQIMEFRKADSANLRLKVSEGDISDFVRRICEDSFMSIDDRNIRLHFESDPDPIIGWFDPDKLDKIMYNLISNAFKYNRRNGEVFVSLRSDGEKIRIEVRDTGYGIEPDRLKDLFKRFYEGEYRKFKTKGTGIGLSLTKDLVTLHNGTIDVESEPDRGTRFTVVLPVTSDAFTGEQIDNVLVTELPATVEPVVGAGDSEDGGKEHPTLLIAEDNLELLGVMRNIMSARYDVLTARDGVEALAVLRQNYVELMITDFQMPNMTGPELVRTVRADMELCHLPIIMLSVYSTKEHKLSSFDSGANAYVTKPFETSVLLAQVDSMIENNRRIKADFQKSHLLDIGKMISTDFDRQFIGGIIDLVKDNISNPDFGNEELCRAVNMSNSTLYRKIKSITGRSPQDFVRNVRLKLACNMLLAKGINISDVAYRLGYNDPKYFSTSFRKEFGVSPREFIRQNHEHQ